MMNVRPAEDTPVPAFGVTQRMMRFSMLLMCFTMLAHAGCNRDTGNSGNNGSSGDGASSSSGSGGSGSGGSSSNNSGASSSSGGAFSGSGGGNQTACSTDAECAAGCMDGVRRAAGTCGTNGLCTPPPVSCNGYTCSLDGLSCLSACTQASHCVVETHYCDNVPAGAGATCEVYVPDNQVCAAAKAGNDCRCRWCHSDGFCCSAAAVPTVTAVEPPSGPLAGGQRITVRGTLFKPGAEVRLGGNLCTNVTLVAPDRLTCNTPPATVTDGMPVEVMVLNNNGQNGVLADGYRYLTPAITNLDPTSLVVGASLTITATPFVAVGVVALLDATPCSQTTFVDANTARCTVPATQAPGSYSVTLRNPDGVEAVAQGTVEVTRGLAFVVGTGSPTPADPDDYGATNVDVVHTFTLTNLGAVSTSAISLQMNGSASALWQILPAGNNCVGQPLAPSATCTFDVAFAAGTPGTLAGAQTATVIASATTGGQSMTRVMGTAAYTWDITGETCDTLGATLDTYFSSRSVESCAVSGTCTNVQGQMGNSYQCQSVTRVGVMACTSVVSSTRLYYCQGNSGGPSVGACNAMSGTVTCQ